MDVHSLKVVGIVAVTAAALWLVCPASKSIHAMLPSVPHSVCST